MILLYEIKKIVMRKTFILAVLGTFLLCICLCAFEIHQHEYYNESGEFERGLQAVEKLKQQHLTTNGKMSDKKLQNIFHFYKEVMDDPMNTDAYGNLYMKKVGYHWQKNSNLIDLLTRTYSSIQSYDTTSLAEKKIEDIHVEDIFKVRKDQLFKFMNRQDGNGSNVFLEAEKKRIILFDKLGEEKIYPYEDATGWNALFSHVKILAISLLIIAAIIGSKLFNSDVQAGVSSLLFTTYKGRTLDIIYKIIAAFIVITICTIFFQLFYASMMLFVFGSSGVFTIIQYQATYWLSIFPFTNIQAYLFIIILGYCGCLTMLVISMLFSRYTKKEYISLMCSLMMLFVPLIWKMQILMFPADMCNGNLQLMTLSIQSFCNIVIFEYELQLMITLIFIACILQIVYSYRKKHHPILLD